MLLGSVKPAEDNPEFDPGRIFIKSVPYMVESARTAAQIDAHSYRDFRVGAALFAYTPQTHETAIIAAGNLKHKRQAKVCAERKVLETAKKSGFIRAGGLVVAGTTDIEKIREVTDAASRTLHPCVECQNLFHDHPLMQEDTPILTTGLDLDRYQVHTASELYDLYAAEEFEELAAEGVAFGFDNGWDQRVTRYDTLVQAEQWLPAVERRPIGMLVQMALMSQI